MMTSRQSGFPIGGEGNSQTTHGYIVVECSVQLMSDFYCRLFRGGVGMVGRGWWGGRGGLTINTYSTYKGTLTLFGICCVSQWLGIFRFYKIGSGNALLRSGNKPYIETMLPITINLSSPALKQVWKTCLNWSQDSNKNDNMAPKHSKTQQLCIFLDYDVIFKHNTG